MTQIKNKIWKIEKYIFVVITILNLIPVLSCKFFPTLDGAAHLYNSNLIINLLFYSNSQLSDFFILNHLPVPNITGHFILSFFNLFLPAFIAEKILLLFILIVFPYAFRKLIKTLATDNFLLCYLIFPFTYSYVFYLGFYNFCIGLVFLFITLNFWIKTDVKKISFSIILKLFLLITITYFSHIFVFGILLFLLGLHTFFQTVSRFFQHYQIKDELPIFAKKTVILLLSSLIPLILLFIYFSSRTGLPNNVYLSSDELIGWLKNLRPIIALSFGKEEKYTYPIVFVLAILFLTTFYIRIKSLKIADGRTLKNKITSGIKQFFNISDIWLSGSIIILFLYFKLPDSDGYAGYVSVRLCLIFFLLIITWLSVQKYPKWLMVISVVIVLYCNFGLIRFYYSATKELNEMAIDCNKASEYIAPASIVLPLNFSDNWLAAHFSNYLGIDKPMVILENYECSTGYFPVKWNEIKLPNSIFGDISSNQIPCVNWISNAKNKTVLIDYVFIYGDLNTRTDSCSNKISTNIMTMYKLIYNSPYCSLYQKK